MNKKLPLLIGAFLLTVATTYAAATTFTDEATFASWYKDAVKHMQDAGVVTGYADGSFKPDQSVTRGELSLMLDRYGEKVVDPKVKEASGGMTEAMVDEKIKAYFDEHRKDYFDAYIDDVISNINKFADQDIDYKTFVIMAESGVRRLSKAPTGEMNLIDEATLPAGYMLYQEKVDENMADPYDPPYYLNYKGELIDPIDGTPVAVDRWYGPF